MLNEVLDLAAAGHLPMVLFVVCQVFVLSLCGLVVWVFFFIAGFWFGSDQFSGTKLNLQSQ